MKKLLFSALFSSLFLPAQSLHQKNIFNSPDANSQSLSGVGAATLADEFSVLHNAGKWIFLKKTLAKKNELINFQNSFALANGTFWRAGYNQTALFGGGEINPFFALAGAFSFGTKGIHLTEEKYRNIGEIELVVNPSFRLIDGEKQQLGTGMNLRYYGDFSQRFYVQSFAVDLGVFYQIQLFKNRNEDQKLTSYQMNFALSLQNLFGKLFQDKMILDAPFLPTAGKFGWSHYLFFQKKHLLAFHYESKKTLILSNTDPKKDVFSAFFGSIFSTTQTSEADFLDKASEWLGTIEHHLAAEFGYGGIFTFRSGFVLGPKKYHWNTAWTTGFAFRYKGMDLSFGYRLPLQTLAYSQEAFFLGLAWNFKKF